MVGWRRRERSVPGARPVHGEAFADPALPSPRTQPAGSVVPTSWGSQAARTGGPAGHETTHSEDLRTEPPAHLTSLAPRKGGGLGDSGTHEPCGVPGWRGLPAALPGWAAGRDAHGRLPSPSGVLEQGWSSEPSPLRLPGQVWGAGLCLSSRELPRPRGLFLVGAQAPGRQRHSGDSRLQVDLWHVGLKTGTEPRSPGGGGRLTPGICFPRYRVVVSYPPQSEAEIELKEGDVVFVHKKREDGWYKGTLQRNGRTGLFPGSFVESF